MSKSLDLGSGPDPKNPFGADEVFGVDIVDFGNPNIKVADLAINPIPFESNTLDYVTGFDFLEHIPRVLYIDGKRRQPFIELMGEVWRVLKKESGQALFATPAYPHPEAFQDPQHVNVITEQSIIYFSYPSPVVNNWSQLELGQAYGFNGAFSIIDQYWRQDVPYHLIWHLLAVEK